MTGHTIRMQEEYPMRREEHQVKSSQVK